MFIKLRILWVLPMQLVGGCSELVTGLCFSGCPHKIIDVCVIQRPITSMSSNSESLTMVFQFQLLLIPIRNPSWFFSICFLSLPLLLSYMYVSEPLSLSLYWFHSSNVFLECKVTHCHTRLLGILVRHWKRRSHLWL